MLLREAKSLPTNRLFMWKLVMKSSFLIAGAALLACTLPNKFEATLLGRITLQRPKSRCNSSKTRCVRS